MNDAIKMQISAFVDGELPQNEAELLLRRLCHDRGLRQQAAEYLAMGRVIRGERMLAGMSVLRERIAAELDEPGLDQGETDTAPTAPRFMRPLAGVAIAATVALAATLGLQQLAVEPSVEEPAAATIAETPADSYTTPDSMDDALLDYVRRHNDSSQYIGLQSINSRLVTYQVADELPAEGRSADAVDDTNSDADEAPETPAP